MAPQLDKLMDDSKALTVGWSRWRLVHWMEQWAATADDDGQQRTGTNITPTPDKSILIINRLPHPLLDGGHGKTDSTPWPCGGCPALGPGSNGDVGEGTSGVDGDRDGGASNKAKASTDGALHLIHQRDWIHPSNMSLPIKCVCLHPSEATPTPKGEPPPPCESLRVNVCLHPSEATPTPKGATPLPGESLKVSGINKLVNWQSPSPFYNGHDIVQCRMVGWRKTAAHLASGSLERLHPPSLAAMGNLVTGVETNKLWLQNRWRCHALQDRWLLTSMWTAHLGTSILPPAKVQPIT